MKRCPVDQGGCGMLVEMLFDSGLCQSCDAAVRKGTAAVGGKLSPPTRRAKTAPASAGPAAPKPIATPGTCSHGCGRPRHLGRCAKPVDPNAKPKRKYQRRVTVAREIRDAIKQRRKKSL